MSPIRLSTPLTKPLTSLMYSLPKSVLSQNCYMVVLLEFEKTAMTTPDTKKVIQAGNRQHPKMTAQRRVLTHMRLTPQMPIKTDMMLITSNRMKALSLKLLIELSPLAA